MRPARQLLTLVLSALLISCGGYRHPDFVIRVPSYYAHQAESGPLTVAADPYLTEGKQDMLFNYYPAKKGLYPVHLIFFNQGKDVYDLKKLDISLVEGSGKGHKPLTEAETRRLGSRNIFARTLKYGIVSSPTFFFAVPIALLGGFDTYKANAFTREVIDENSLKQGQLEPGKTFQGFVFFAPAQGLKGREFREKMRSAYSVQILGVQDPSGEALNFSIYLPSGEPVTL